MWLSSLWEIHISVGKANANISKRPIGKGKDAVSSDMVHEGNDYASRTKSHQGLGRAVCSRVRHVTIHSSPNEPKKPNPGEEGIGKWKRIKHPLRLATTMPQPLPTEAD